MNKKLFMGAFDGMLVKYGAVLIGKLIIYILPTIIKIIFLGYAILGLPVFGPGSEEYIKNIGSDSTAITRDYVRNSSLLINLSKAIGRLVISYKEI